MNLKYSVSITDEEAKASRAHSDVEKDAKRLFPKNAPKAAPGEMEMAVSSGLELLLSLMARKESFIA